jgi:hypothetical protein
MADEKKMISEKVEVLLSEGESMDYQTFLDKIQDVHTRNQYRSFEKFSIKLEKTKELGWLVCFDGDRPETPEEKAKRESEDGIRRRQVEEAELKEFLRLKKKYGKTE